VPSLHQIFIRTILGADLPFSDALTLHRYYQKRVANTVIFMMSSLEVIP